MTALAHSPRCLFCLQPVGPADAVAVRLGGKLLGVAHAPHAKLAMQAAIVARKYGPAFLRGFLAKRYPKGFSVAKELYETLLEARNAQVQR